MADSKVPTTKPTQPLIQNKGIQPVTPASALAKPSLEERVKNLEKAVWGRSD